MLRVAFVGLGQMGVPMSGHLRAAGFPLRTFDLNGTGNCRSLAEAIANAEVLITMLPDGKIVRAVLEEAMSSLAAGTIVLDMSSSDPVGTRSLGESLAAKRLVLVDAPVSGGVRRAKTAQLSIMAGGDAAAIERIRPLLEKLGSQVFLTGPLGSGHAMKALNNYLSAVGLEAACEAIQIGKAFGLDPAVMTDVLNAATGKNNSTEVKLKQFILSGGFNAGFTVGLMAKDLDTAVSVADAVGAGAPLARHTAAMWRDALAQLGAGADHTEIYRYLERQRRA